MSQQRIPGYVGVPPVEHPLPTLSEKSARPTLSKSKRYCPFCKENGESVEVYSQHYLKNRFGQVTCPQLRKHICQFCGATGDNAHTLSYCPEKHEADTNYLGNGFFINMVGLKNTTFNSAGIRLKPRKTKDEVNDL